jgi:glyoxylase-like metal-dependent hydrolase (beta-lactamase superfamily II)
MNIEPVTTGAFEEICYILWSDEKKALVVDPGHDAEEIHEIIHRHQLEVAAYVCTHGHTDHINALAELHEKHPAPVAMHALDLEWAFGDANRMEPYYPVPPRPQVEQFEQLDRKTDWQFADLRFECIQTPGHTPGSCCLYFKEEQVLVAGDTLFKGSCGRTDLPGGSPRQMQQSLQALKNLPDDTRVYPGHGPDTTIGYERATNYFMQ